MNGRAWLGLALLFSCAPELDDTGVTEATRRMVRATRVGVDNADQLLLSGLRADGIPGDYALTNDSLTAIIDATGLDEDRDRPEQRHRGSSGGTLIDLAPPGGRDALPQVLQLVGFDPQLRVHYQSVTVEEGGKAIHAVGRILDPERKIGVALDEHDLIEQVVVSTTWRMWDHQPWVQVETQVANQTSRPVELDPIVDLFVTDGQGAVPFVPSPGVGYDLPEGRTVLCPWLVLDADPGLPGAFAVLALEDGSLAVMAERDLDGRVRGVFVGKEDRAKDAIAPGDQRSWTRRYTASPGQDMTGVVRNVLELLGQQAGSYYLELGLSEGSDVRLDLGRSRQARATFHRLDPARYLDQEGRIRDGGVLPMATAWVGEGEATLETWLSPSSRSTAPWPWARKPSTRCSCAWCAPTVSPTSARYGSRSWGWGARRSPSWAAGSWRARPSARAAASGPTPGLWSCDCRREAIACMSPRGRAILSPPSSFAPRSPRRSPSPCPRR